MYYTIYHVSACILCFYLMLWLFKLIGGGLRREPKTVPLSVNYHFTRKCNYKCGFCFHTDTNSYTASMGDAKKALKLLADAGMKKVNFAGGEPFLYAPKLGSMVDYTKRELGLESVSIVSNGSLIREDWIKKHARNLDILAISCDSFDESTNTKIGRGSGQHIAQLRRIAGWCKTYGVMFKLNSVICQYNWDEDMNEHIATLNPYRWKCFQVLIVAGENDGDDTKRDARDFVITDDQFRYFCDKHRHNPSFVPESNALMAKSYLILDEHLRFLDRTGKAPSKSILDVGVDAALASVFWDKDGFKERGGVYAWNQDQVEEADQIKTKAKDEQLMALKNQLGFDLGGNKGGCGGGGSGGCDNAGTDTPEDNNNERGGLLDMEDIGFVFGEPMS
ncbi:hypothetical protein H2204_008228 [Knufia peltigerae]|uniref:Radical SAM core domain-containing protein n=1 Tax=Knufia peltigerae TaxID=1002370 RepID=A0AA38Y0H8_9EURO|nr:hypothetical protein H2204_008228 [Knufia peltigerae]